MQRREQINSYSIASQGENDEQRTTRTALHQLDPEQAETVTAAGDSIAKASYGIAGTDFTRMGPRSFKASTLSVVDRAKDGHPVYARFQGRATDGTVLTTPTKRFDRKGADGPGTGYRNLTGTFSKNISQMRVAIYLDRSGTDPVTVGNWSDI